MPFPHPKRDFIAGVEDVDQSRAVQFLSRIHTKEVRKVMVLSWFEDGLRNSTELFVQAEYACDLSTTKQQLMNQASTQLIS